MAEYNKIKGFTVQALDTDPVLWAGAWASGGSMNAVYGMRFGF